MSCANAETPPLVTDCAEEQAACDAALGKADNLIDKQGELIMILQKRADDKQDENERLAKAVIELKNVSDRAFEKNLTYGLGGVMLGVIAILLLKH